MTIVIVIAVTIVYYAYGTRWTGRGARIAVRRFGFGGNQPLIAAEDTAKLLLASVSQAVVALVATRFFPFSSSPSLLSVTPGEAGLGALLGIAEFGVAGQLALCMSAGLALIQRRVQPSTDEMLAASRSGWMRQYLATMKTLPPIGSVPLIVLYVAGEEYVFRVLVYSHARDAVGQGSALVISTLLFVIVQSFNMPRFSASLYAMSGALVLGIIHGHLFARLGLFWPLVLAHVTFFFGAVALSREKRLPGIASF